MRITLVLAASILLLTPGCKKRAPAPAVPSSVGPVAPKPNMFLRASFDTDPSSYLGRFLPADGTAFDESLATKTACSKHITYKKIGGGNITYDEVYEASTQAAASFGIPLVVKVGGEHGASTTVRVKYTLTNKLVGDVDDPVAFEACCKQAADQCTDLYIGEFLEGSGELFYQTTSSTSGKGAGKVSAGIAKVDIRDGVSWTKSVAFPQPVYFAFKTTKNPYSGAQVAGCGDWVNAPPKSTQGNYFVGVSDPLVSEKTARDQAMANARVQTVKWAAEEIKAGGVSAEIVSGLTDALDTAVHSEQTLLTASAGVASLVKDESWCVTTSDTPAGSLFTAKVLAFVPKDKLVDIAKAAVGPKAKNPCGAK